MERRAHHRTPSLLGQQIFAQGTFWPIAMLDFSASGAFLFVPDSLYLCEGDRVMLKLGELPSFAAEVVWAWDDRIGVEFCDQLHPSIAALFEELPFSEAA